jgi:hypothetical protein
LICVGLVTLTRIPTGWSDLCRVGIARAEQASDQGFLPIEVEHYVMLLDRTGRELCADKRAAIPDHLAPIVERLGLNRSNWVETVRGFGRLFKQAAGRSSSLVDAAARRSRRWFQGKAAARTAFVWATGSTPSPQQRSP